MPVGAWIRIDIPEHPNFVGFTYVDHEAGAGFSAQGGGYLIDGSLDESPDLIIVRLQLGHWKWTVLTDHEIGQYALPTRPTWVDELYGPQPEPGSLWGWWRDHEILRDRFHPEYPDDLQVIVHDGGPRLTDRSPELIWVRVVGGHGDVFHGQLLNEPHNLQSVSQGSDISFVVPEGYEQPVMVTDKYLSERSDWIVHPCKECGIAELFDAPSDLMRVVFPHTPAKFVFNSFTAICGACGGFQFVQHKSDNPDEAAVDQPKSTKKRW